MMDEEETKNCPNCKREIPAVNFTIHTVHCARNIRVCPVCKEPVPGSELDDHHKKFHKLLPCKQCGESVCGTDLEDHIRDSCANTIKSCRFCELELPRRELPAHEGYCGVRTEQCPECKEWVMIKYKQLHVDSNHGFIRLDDDPPPPKKEPPKLNIRSAGSQVHSSIRSAARPNLSAINVAPTSVFGSSEPSHTNRPSCAANNRLKSNSFGLPSNFENDVLRPKSSSSSNAGAARPTSFFNEAGPSNFRNDFPRASQSIYQGSSNSGSSVSSSSASTQEGSTSGSRPVSNGVKKRTNDQPQINIYKEIANKIYKDLPISRGAVKKRPAPKPPRAAPAADPQRDMAYYSALQRQQREERERNEQNEYNLAHGLPPVLTAAAKVEKLRKMDALQNRDSADAYRIRVRKAPANDDDERRRQEFKNLKPMSPEQFLARFNSLQVREEEGAGGDRFSEIKSSLRELRRGLNEVTAPYNNNNMNASNNNERGRSPSPPEELRLPCEFCSQLVPADDLVQHETGCRPDLAQYRGAGLPAAPPATPATPATSATPATPATSATPATPATPDTPAPAPYVDPVIPCEFCAQSLPVYLITEHQERCARDVGILSVD